MAIIESYLKDYESNEELLDIVEQVFAILCKKVDAKIEKYKNKKSQQNQSCDY